MSELSLVDWRVRVADLYAQVRADDDPARAHATWRAGRDRLFREHPQSPLPAHDPLRETGLPVWEYDPAWRFELPRGGGLDVWSLHQYGDGLFVPVKDAKGAWLGGSDDAVVVDLNFAYHPSCRYDPRWRCPLAPPGNVLDVEVRAGERLP
ncbi:DUF1684 domain-containing protein [Aeromicrobium halocynthiae]|uniref:DUF1684 domain-containing protein n=1 Tax=Aeromicrobium halocynthiae TaxID=560557 RepID=UPI0031D81505